MNAPFQSVGIIFIVTMVHVLAIALYSSRNLPESTFQRSLVMPSVESLEVMPEQSVRGMSTSEADKAPESCLECLEEGDLVESDRVKDEAMIEEWAMVVAPEVVTEPLIQEEKDEVLEPTKEADEHVPAEKVVQADVAPVIKAERWEDSDFARRVPYPHLDGILGKKSKKLAENRPNPAPSSESESPAKEPAPRSRSFSPVPRS
jgi:hypothetical protein